MSVTLTISEKTYQKLKNVAQSKGFEDMEKFLDEWEELELANRREVVDRILEFQNKMGEKYGVMLDSTELIREDRMR
jgi:predicted house-cleaning noncanonical NTP pyrophosphatase (MazG superfamily)